MVSGFKIVLLFIVVHANLFSETSLSAAEAHLVRNLPLKRIDSELLVPGNNEFDKRLAFERKWSLGFVRSVVLAAGAIVFSYPPSPVLASVADALCQPSESKCKIFAEKEPFKDTTKPAYFFEPVGPENKGGYEFSNLNIDHSWKWHNSDDSCYHPDAPFAAAAKVYGSGKNPFAKNEAAMIFEGDTRYFNPILQKGSIYTNPRGKGKCISSESHRHLSQLTPFQKSTLGYEHDTRHFFSNVRGPDGTNYTLALPEDFKVEAFYTMQVTSQPPGILSFARKAVGHYQTLVVFDREVESISQTRANDSYFKDHLILTVQGTNSSGQTNFLESIDGSYVLTMSIADPEYRHDYAYVNHKGTVTEMHKIDFGVELGTHIVRQYLKKSADLSIAAPFNLITNNCASVFFDFLRKEIIEFEGIEKGDLRHKELMAIKSPLFPSDTVVRISQAGYGVDFAGYARDFPLFKSWFTQADLENRIDWGKSEQYIENRIAFQQTD